MIFFVWLVLGGKPCEGRQKFELQVAPQSGILGKSFQSANKRTQSELHCAALCPCARTKWKSGLQSLVPIFLDRGAENSGWRRHF